MTNGRSLPVAQRPATPAPDIAPETFREVLGRFPTGVAVIASAVDGVPIGVAANSLASVSLQPPLVLFCPARSSQTWPQLRRTGGFCINVLSTEAEHLSRAFAVRDADRFAGVRFTPALSGRPILDEAIAWVDCELATEYDGGDHTIVLGRVVELGCRDGEPLIFYAGSHHRLPTMTE